MSPTDALFWSMDRVPELRSTTGALVMLKRKPSYERLHAAFSHLAQQMPRLRQRVVEVPFSLAPPEWIYDEQFDLDYHLRHLAVPQPGGVEELLTELSPLFATALDPQRPLWEAYVADGLRGQGAAVLLKMHHCMTDGVGASQVFASLLARRRQPPVQPVGPVSDGRSTSPSALIGRALRENVGGAWEFVRGAANEVAPNAVHPLGMLRGVGRAVRMLSGFGHELALRRAESPLQQKRSLSRRLATFEMSRKEIDAARGAVKATNNDLVLTIVSGAMRRWHGSRGEHVHELRVLVPVSLRESADACTGNRLAFIAVSLPIDEPDPMRRLRLIQSHMGEVKGDQRAKMYPALARVMAAMPASVAEVISRQQTTRTNFVCTNVPGPQHVCYLAGEKIEAVYPYAPLVGDHPVAIALYSYGDMLYVGLDVDPLAMGDLPRFQEALAESYAEVLACARGRRARKPPARARRRGRERKTVSVSEARSHNPG